MGIWRPRRNPTSTTRRGLPYRFPGIEQSVACDGIRSPTSPLSPMVQPWQTPASCADTVDTPMRYDELGWGRELADSREPSTLPESPSFPSSPAGSVGYLPFPFEPDKATPSLSAPNISESGLFLDVSGSAEQSMVGSSPSPGPFHPQSVFSLTAPSPAGRPQSQRAAPGCGPASPIQISNGGASGNRRRSATTGGHRLSMPLSLTIPKGLVKDGDMIRILLKTPSTEVPCIALCAFTRMDSIADEAFFRQWKAVIRPVPKQRWKDAKLYCTLDVLDVEKVGRVDVNLDVPLGKLPDQRVQVVLSYKALVSLRLVPSLEGVNNSMSQLLSKSAPPSRIVPTNQFLGISPTPRSHLAPLSDSGLEDASHRYLRPVPQIKIHTADFGSTSADSSPNGDQSSNASSWFRDDGQYVTSRATSECGFTEPADFGDVADMYMGYDESEGRPRGWGL